MPGITPELLSGQLDEHARRLRVLEGHSLGIPFNPPPAANTQTLVVNDSVPATGLITSSGIITLQSRSFTLAGAGSIIVEGAIEARMEAWDNTVGAPRREGWVDVSGIVATSHSEWPFGITTVTHSWASALTAIAAGTYTARALFQLAGFNQVRVYGGYLRVTFYG